MMFNWQRNLMKLSRFQALCLVAVIAMGICTSRGQTNGPPPQAGPRVAPSNGVRGSNVRPNNSNLPYVPRGPANIGQRPIGTLPAQVQSQPPTNLRPNYPPPPTNLRPNYPPLTRQLSPRLAAMRIQQRAPTDNVEQTGNLLSQSGIVQTPLSIPDDQRVVRTDDLKPTNQVLVKREISEGLEAIDPPRSARNGDVQPIARDSANRDFKQHKVK